MADSGDDISQHADLLRQAVANNTVAPTDTLAAVAKLAAPGMQAAAHAATTWLNQNVSALFKQLEQHGDNREGKIFLRLGDFSQNPKIDELADARGLAELAEQKQLLYLDTHLTRSPAVVLNGYLRKDYTPEQFTVKQFLRVIKAGPQRSAAARATQRRPEESISRARPATMRRPEPPSASTDGDDMGYGTPDDAAELPEEIPEEVDVDEHLSAQQLARLRLGTVWSPTAATDEREQASVDEEYSADTTRILGSTKQRPARNRTNTYPDANGVLRTSPVRDQGTIRQPVPASSSAVDEFAKSAATLVKAGVKAETITSFDILAWGTAQLVSTLKAAHAEASDQTALKSMSLRPVSMAGETPNAHPATVSTEGEQTTRVKMLLAEQYRKRPELDVNWAAFSLPELETFLNILAAEEELHKQQVLALYKAKRTSLQRQIDAALEAQTSAISALDAAVAELSSMSSNLAPAQAIAASSVRASDHVATSDDKGSEDFDSGTIRPAAAPPRQLRPELASKDAESLLPESSSVNKNSGRPASMLEYGGAAEGNLQRQRSQVISRTSRATDKTAAALARARSVRVVPEERQAVDLVLTALQTQSAGSSPLGERRATADRSQHASTSSPEMRRKNHASLSVDDIVGVDPSGAAGVKPEVVRQASRWVDDQLRLLASAIRQVGVPVRDDSSVPGVAYCKFGELRRCDAGIEELPGTLLNGLERGIVSFEPQRRLQPEADDEVVIALLRHDVPAANSKTYQPKHLRRASMRLSRRPVAADRSPTLESIV